MFLLFAFIAGFTFFTCQQIDSHIQHILLNQHRQNKRMWLSNICYLWCRCDISVCEGNASLDEVKLLFSECLCIKMLKQRLVDNYWHGNISEKYSVADFKTILSNMKIIFLWVYTPEHYSTLEGLYSFSLLYFTVYVMFVSVPNLLARYWQSIQCLCVFRTCHVTCRSLSSMQLVTETVAGPSVYSRTQQRPLTWAPWSNLETSDTSLVTQRICLVSDSILPGHLPVLGASASDFQSKASTHIIGSPSHWLAWHWKRLPYACPRLETFVILPG